MRRGNGRCGGDSGGSGGSASAAAKTNQLGRESIYGGRSGGAPAETKRLGVYVRHSAAELVQAKRRAALTGPSGHRSRRSLPRALEREPV